MVAAALGDGDFLMRRGMGSGLLVEQPTLVEAFDDTQGDALGEAAHFRDFVRGRGLPVGEMEEMAFFFFGECVQQEV